MNSIAERPALHDIFFSSLGLTAFAPTTCLSFFEVFKVSLNLSNESLLCFSRFSVSVLNGFLVVNLYLS